jgi:hypothetical protein
MTPFQFYVAKRFPRMKAGENVVTQVQMTTTGEDEPVRTEITSVQPKYEQGLSLLQIKSEVRHEVLGYIKVIRQENKRERIDFHEYLEPVDFYAYHDHKRKIVMFQAPRVVCKGVFGNLAANSADVALQEMEVDFSLVLQECRQFLGAWFRRVSTRVNSAGLSGNQIQNDNLFRYLAKFGHLSNVTIPWVLSGVEHKVMITQRGSIVLVQNYKDKAIELQLVLDVYDKLLSKVWRPRELKDDTETQLAAVTEETSD